MKRTIHTYQFKMNMSFRSTVLVASTIISAAFLGFMYSLAPATVTTSFLMSGLFLFLVSIYIAMCMAEKENIVQEQLLLLHSQKEGRYYGARELVLYSIVFLYAAVLMAVPIIKNVQPPYFFTRPLAVRDVVCGSLFVLINGMCGAAVGDFLHPRIWKERNKAIVLAVLIALLSICKTSIVHEFRAMKYVVWILPPIMDGFEMVGSSDLFDVGGSAFVFVHMLLYVLIISGVKIGTLKKNRFDG